VSPPANEDGVALLPGVTPAATPAAASDAAICVTFAAGGRLLVARASGRIELIDVTTGQRQPLDVKLLAPRVVALSPAGDRVFVANADAAEIFHITSSSKTRIAGGDVTAAAFSRTGGLLTGHAGGEVKIWDTPGWQNVATLRPNVGAVARIMPSPATAHLAVIGASGGVAVCDVNDQQVKQRLGAQQAWTAVDFAPDGRTIAAAGPAGIAMWDTMLWQTRAAPSVPADQPPTHVAFWRGGAVVVTASADGAVRIYDVATRQLLTTLAAGNVSGPIASLALGADDRTIAVAAGAQVTLWDSAARSVSRTFNP
jgi:WD40 repeat protein